MTRIWPIVAAVTLLQTACSGGCSVPGLDSDPAVLGSGTVHVVSEPPGATVSTEGRKLGVTPLTLDILTYDIEHRLFIELIGYKRHEIDFVIEPNEARTEKVQLTKDAAPPTP